MEHEEWKQEAMEGPGFWKYGGFLSETGGKEWNMRNEGMRQEAVRKRQAQDIGLKRQAGRKHLLLGALSPRAFEPLLHLLHRQPSVYNSNSTTNTVLSLDLHTA